MLMTLSSGARLGPNEILAPIGAGGMGEVYRARDTRLERTVAVKVLPRNLSASPELRQRFEREAKTISQLSHPHICALYDVGREGAIDYLVMEYREGGTLSNRLAKGARPLEQTLRLATEIADALDKAHRQRIVPGVADRRAPKRRAASNFLGRADVARQARARHLLDSGCADPTGPRSALHYHKYPFFVVRGPVLLTTTVHPGRAMTDGRDSALNRGFDYHERLVAKLAGLVLAQALASRYSQRS